MLGLICDIQNQCEMIGTPEAWAILFAFSLDLLLGDPKDWPHPVRWMGTMIIWSENFWRKTIASEFWAGAGMALSLVVSVWLAANIFLQTLMQLGEVFYWAGSAILIYYCLSVRSLAEGGMRVAKALGLGELESARKQLSAIVGRDTESLDTAGVVRATVETVSENFVDGVLAPLFFVIVGGPAAALAYKVVNTLDSMVGYKNERYKRFGTFSARLDDVANFIPARLSLFPIAFSAMLCNKSSLMAIRMCLRDARNHSSPNSGFPEAAFAGALNLRLGGPSFYNGVLVEKPFIGEEEQPPQCGKIKEAVYLMVASSLVAAVACMLLIA